MSIAMISCSDMTVSSGYTYNPYPYSNYYYYHRPYYYRPVYRERIIVVTRHRNTNKRYYDSKNSRRFGKGQRNTSSSIGHFSGRR